jgi:hypothetical protein
MGKLYFKLDGTMQSETGCVLSLTCVNRFNIVFNEDLLFNTTSRL